MKSAELFGSALRGFVTSWGSYATIWAAWFSAAKATGVNSAMAKAKAAALAKNVLVISIPSSVSVFVDYEMPAHVRLDALDRGSSDPHRGLHKGAGLKTRDPSKGKAANL